MARQFEYRIKYKRPPDHLTNYHYYMAESAEQALDFQLQAIEQHSWKIELVDMDKKCPWSNKWINKKHVLNNMHVKDKTEI